jgi:hypothetical protein
LEDLDAVRAFARDFCATRDRIDVLIHNAGAIDPGFRMDTGGTELTIAGQVVAPFLLTRLLMPALVAAAPSRLVTVWGRPSRGDRRRRIQSWRRQGGTAWLLPGHLSVGAGMTEQQAHEVVDHQDGFEVRRTWWPESSWTARLTRCESGCGPRRRFAERFGGVGIIALMSASPPARAVLKVAGPRVTVDGLLAPC